MWWTFNQRDAHALMLARILELRAELSLMRAEAAGHRLETAVMAQNFEAMKLAARAETRAVPPASPHAPRPGAEWENEVDWERVEAKT
ncbi:MAG: hypothetical protein ACRD2E_08870 [Terriglobales bacterium]